MALVVKDRVKETTSTTGTGTLTLGGAVTGFQTFTSVLSNSDTTYYAIFESSTGQFEVGLGTFTSSGTTLARTTVLESSNSGNAINLTAGAADVFITQPAEKSVYLDSSGHIAAADGRNVTNVAASTATTAGTVTTAAQPNITSLGTLTGLDINGDLNAVDNVIVASTVQHEGDSNTYLGFGTDNVELVAGGTQRLLANSSGVTINDITINGSTISDGADLTIDVGGDIILDADGAEIILKDGGTSFGRFNNDSSNLVIQSDTSDKDIKFKGKDGTSFITALTLDMSDAGTAIFNHDVKVNDNSKFFAGTSGDLEIYHNGTNSVIYDNGTGNLQLVSNGASVDIIKAGGENMANFATDGAVTLYYDNAAKITTASTGAIILHNNNNYDDGLTLRSTLNWGYGTSLSFDAIATSGGSNATVGKIQSRWLSAGNHALDFYTYGSGSLTKRARLDNEGNLGVGGNTSPSSYNANAHQLVIGNGSDSQGITIATGTGTYGNIFFADSTGSGAGSYAGFIQYTHNTDTLHFGTAGSTKATINSSGTLSVGALTVDDITIDGSTISDGGDLDFDIGGDLNIDVDGGDVRLKDGGTQFASLYKSGNNFGVYSAISDGDLLLQGVDGGSLVTALTLDMSAAGAATFNAGAIFNNDVGIGGAVVPHSSSYVSATLHLRQETSNYGSLIRMTTGNSGHTATDGSYIALWTDNNMYYRVFEGTKHSFFVGSTEKIAVNSSGIDVTGSVTADNIYVADKIYHEGDTDTYMGFGTNEVTFYTAGTLGFAVSSSWLSMQAPNYNYYNYFDESSQLTGTTPTINAANSGVFYITLSGNTTFTFTNTSSGWGVGFILYLTGNGSTVTWPGTVDWAGGTAPDAPANGETDVLVFTTRDGSNWFGALAIDAAA